MELIDFLRSIPSIAHLRPRSHLLLVAYYLRTVGQTSFLTSELAEQCLLAGIHLPEDLDETLEKMSGMDAPFVRMEEERFALSLVGVEEVERFLESTGAQTPRTTGLERLVGRLATETEKQFLAEAISCVGVQAKRAAVVLTWILTMNHLQAYVFANKLAEFNAALAARPDYAGTQIVAKDDFTLIRKESHFIEILKQANIITGDVRKILDGYLGFRNTCGHPNEIVIPGPKVAAMIEDLVENVVLKYPV